MFIPGNKEERPGKDDDFAFIFSGDDILLKNARVPSIGDINSLLTTDEALYFGTAGNRQCYAFTAEQDSGGILSSGGFEAVMLRRHMAVLDPGISAAAGFSYHLAGWDLGTRFCGRCGAENEWYGKEFAKKCPSCGNLQFPKISPAIIIAVVRDGRLLLAHNRRFPEGRYSLLAGFMNIGETIEETAAREVYEETGIVIDNIRYVSSQHWPFPDSLMIGLTADYKSGEITPDGEEIIHADWYTPDNFPSIPPHGTIARNIIDRYKNTYTT